MEDFVLMEYYTLSTIFSVILHVKYKNLLTPTIFLNITLRISSFSKEEVNDVRAAYIAHIMCAGCAMHMT